MSLFRKKKKKETPGAFANALAKTLATTSKQLVWVYAINSVLWIWCSYLLAFMNKYQIAETLSSTVCTIVIGQLAFYLITSTIENIFKYNDIFGPRMKYDPTPEIMKSNTEETNHVEQPISQPSPVEPPSAPVPPAAPTGVDAGTVGDIANQVAELAKTRDASIAKCESDVDNTEGREGDVTPVG